MFLQRTEIFSELSPETMAEISKEMSEQSYREGETVYTPSDPAEHFYILVEGTVRLTIRREGEIDYTVSRTGEVFGWAGMMERPLYTAHSQCMAPTRLILIQKKALNRIFEKDPRGGMIFFKKLAGAVFQRLLYSYENFVSKGSLMGITSPGVEEVEQANEE